jgi:signal transduction histidine kinase
MQMFTPYNDADLLVYYRGADFYTIFAIGVFIFNMVVMFNAGFLKHIYHKGFVNGLLKNSLVLGFFIKLFSKLISGLRGIKVAVSDMMTNNDDKEAKKLLIGVLIINWFILCLIALSGSVGLFISIVYSIVLFRYILKFIQQLKHINESVDSLAKGDFNTEFSHSIAMFAPLVNRLNSIKDGLKVAVEKRIKSERLRVELISNVSHDLRTPLTSIINYADILDGTELSDEQQEYVDILKKKSERLKVLIDDIFEVSKASSGNVDLNIEDIDIVALFRQTMGEFEGQINESDLNFKLSLPEKKIICSLDGNRTYRIFENVISNILKYSMKGTRVYINMQSSVEDTISIVFKNISSYEMNFDPIEITNRFSRGDESRNTEGSGLGLSIAKSLVAVQGGLLDIEIDGDLFKLTITFPRKQE